MSKEAMKLALEALTATMATHGFRKHIEEVQDKAIKALEEALAKQEQGEPVAVVDANDEGYWADILPDRSVKVGQLLYTTPQQRTWVGLTDDEKADIAAKGHQRWKEYAEAIEAKLKERNT
jgi:hypothetical protein